MSDARNRDKALLILLIGRLMEARRTNDDDAKEAVTSELQQFSQKTAFPNLATKANVTIVVSSIDDMKEGLVRMAEIADQLSPLRQAFQAGAEIADTGRASLFFPRVASTLVQADEMINSLITTGKNFKDEISEVREGFDLKNIEVLIERLRTSGEELEDALKSLDS